MLSASTLSHFFCTLFFSLSIPTTVRLCVSVLNNSAFEELSFFFLSLPQILEIN